MFGLTSARSVEHLSQMFMGRYYGLVGAEGGR